jgi:hypothetical protein
MARSKSGKRLSQKNPEYGSFDRAHACLRILVGRTTGRQIMIPVSKDILNTAGFFRIAFTIVLALAIGEAFKQFIDDKADRPEHRTIHWDRLPSLISFLFLALPFFHGMNRYFFLAYTNASSVSQHYGSYLLLDGASFISMSAMFFVMSRTLAAVQWRRVCYSIIILLIVDTIWILFAIGIRGFHVELWLILNAILATTLAFSLFFGRATSSCACVIVSSICAITTVLTTTASYYFKWSVFFPGP